VELRRETSGKETAWADVNIWMLLNSFVVVKGDEIFQG
jgi:hypothetical protein